MKNYPNPVGQQTPNSVAVSDNPWLPHMVRLHSIRQEVPGIATYQLRFEDAELASAYSFEPGQFNMLYLPGYGEIAISISSDPDQPETLLHTIRIAGSVTRVLAGSEVGEQIGLRGPFGSAWPMDACRDCDVVIACGGIGIAPLRPALHHIINRRQDFGRVILLYGARARQSLLYTEEYESWREADVELEVTVDRDDGGWDGHIGVVPALFYRLRLDASRTRIFTCGPEIMMRFVVFEALARRIEPSNIFVSMERNMQCAVGFCGHCQLGPAFVCKDGPVFSYERMEPYLRLDDL